MSFPLLVCVPYRAGPQQEYRQLHLKTFLQYMPVFLQDIPHTILVVEQTAGEKFNRGSLLNAGVRWGEGRFSSVCFRDVDLIPGEDMKDAYANTNIHLALEVGVATTQTHI